VGKGQTRETGEKWGWEGTGREMKARGGEGMKGRSNHREQKTKTSYLNPIIV